MVCSVDGDRRRLCVRADAGRSRLQSRVRRGQTARRDHAYEIETSGRGKRSIESISAGGAIYVTIGGKWKKSPLTVRQMQEQEEENIRDARNASCRYLRDEPVEGQAAEVYSAHSETDGLVSDTVVWPAKADHRVLHEEEDMNQSGDKMHMSIRIDYANVAAPAITR